jgi:integrase/recombinase XerC
MMMCVSLFIDYLRYERNYSVHTILAYKNDLSQFYQYIENEYKDKIEVENIDADIIRNWIMYMMKNSLSSVSVNRKVSSVKSYFKFLVRKGTITRSPLSLLSGPKKPKYLPSFVKEKDMVSVLDNKNEDECFNNVRDDLIIELFYETGIRCSELVGLKNSDVDFESMIIKVTGKRNKQRLIPFAERLKNLLLHYNNVRNKEVDAKSENFFVRKNGEGVTSAIVYYIVKKKLSIIPMLSKRSPHVLRHTFATGMLNSGAELGAVRDLLGHSSLSSTSVYTHITFEELKKMYHAHPRAKSMED